MNKSKVWISRQRNGQYMLSHEKPVWDRVMGTKEKDFYFVHGEPFGYRNLCEFSILALFGLNLSIGESQNVWIQGGLN